MLWMPISEKLFELVNQKSQRWGDSLVVHTSYTHLPTSAFNNLFYIKTCCNMSKDKHVALMVYMFNFKGSTTSETAKYSRFPVLPPTVVWTPWKRDSLLSQDHRLQGKGLFSFPFLVWGRNVDFHVSTFWKWLDDLLLCKWGTL